MDRFAQMHQTKPLVVLKHVCVLTISTLSFPVQLNNNKSINHGIRPILFALELLFPKKAVKIHQSFEQEDFKLNGLGVYVRF